MFIISEVVSFHQVTQPFVGMADIHEYDMRTLFVVRADHVIGEKGFTTS